LFNRFSNWSEEEKEEYIKRLSKIGETKYDPIMGLISSGISTLVIPLFIINQQWIVRVIILCLITIVNIYGIQLIRKRESKSVATYYLINTACVICLLFYCSNTELFYEIGSGLTWMSKIAIITATIPLLTAVISKAESGLNRRIEQTNLDLGTYTEPYPREVKVLEKEALMKLFQITSVVIIFVFSIGLLTS
jgi:hypothetical protein